MPAKSAPVNEAESVQAALVAEHAARFDKSRATVPGPTGRLDATPFINMRIPYGDNANLLGAPEKILKDPRPGCKYVWKKYKDAQTAAYIRAKILRPVTIEEIDDDNPMAEYVEVITPSGSYVAWNDLALFEMAPRWVKHFYEKPEAWAIARIAQKAVDFRGQVEDATGGDFTGKLSISSGSKG